MRNWNNESSAQLKINLKILWIILWILFTVGCIISAIVVNNRKIDQKTEQYSMGETVEIGPNFFVDASENPEGYSIRVNDARVVELEPYVAQLGGDIENFVYGDNSKPAKYTYLLDVTIRNTGNKDGGIIAQNYALYHDALKIPTDYVLWGLMDPEFPGTFGFSLQENTELDLTIPFTPMPIDIALNGKEVEKRMLLDDFDFVVSEFPITKMIKIECQNPSEKK